MKIKTFFDFCSGIGGGRIGLEKCGMHCIGRSETSRLSEVTYKLMHGDIEKNYGNLKIIKANTLPLFDLLIAGFPCQTFSVIGRREGFDDKRGQIIFHLIRIMKECRPKCFILENVRGLVSHDKGRTLEIIISTIKEAGYEVIYKVLSSIHYGTPQMRQRIYFIGVDKNSNLNISDFKWPDEIEKPPLSDYLIDKDNLITQENLLRLEYYLKNPTNQGKVQIKDLLDEEYLVIDTRMSDLRLYRERMPTLRSQRDGIYYVKNGELRELTGYEALLLQGFPHDISFRAKLEVSNRHLLMQAGNAMTTTVINELGKALLNLR